MRRFLRTAAGNGRAEQGAALVIGLLLSTLVAMVAIHALAAAELGLRMAANLEHRDRAAEAAEYGILQALSAPGLTTALTYSNPMVVPPNSGNAPAVPGSPTDTYSYRLFLATSASLGSGPPAEATPALVRHHFVVESTGRSRRGASVTLTQGFSVDAPPDAVALDTLPRRRTFWVQADAD